MPLKKCLLFAVLTLLFSSIETRVARANEMLAVPTPRHETVTCIGVDGDIRYDILMEIPNVGDGPIAQLMRVSDPNVSASRSEIAVFDASEGLLNNDDGVIVGYVDETNPKTARKGERIGGTTLGQLRSVMLSLEFDFDPTISILKKYSAQVLYLKKSGKQLVQDLDCTRQR